LRIAHSIHVEGNRQQLIMI